MSAAILFSGSLPTEPLRAFHILKCETITFKSDSFMHRIGAYCFLEMVRLTAAVLHDHSAKFGSYTVIDTHCDKVVDFKLVQVNVSKHGDLFCDPRYYFPSIAQSNEDGGSYHTEKEGLK